MQLRIRSLWARTLHLVEHALAVTLGLALVLVGRALTFSIVFVVPGIIVFLLASPSWWEESSPRVRPPEWRLKPGTLCGSSGAIVSVDVSDHLCDEASSWTHTIVQ
jgi:hypothetical protein